MLEKPALENEKIVACLKHEYGIQIEQVTFLPLGADVNTAVYRLNSANGKSYFLKLRKGPFDETAVALPNYLREQGIDQIISPLPDQSGQLWALLEPFKAILYPFIEGHNGYEHTLSAAHWTEFGLALKKIHAATLPQGLAKGIRKETFSPINRDRVRRFLKLVEGEVIDEPVAEKTADFLKSKRSEILTLIDKADQLAQTLQSKQVETTICHADLHAGNVLIGTDNAFYIVDWDAPIMAPKERDLMYIGGALMASGLSPDKEEDLFYPAYGPTKINLPALAYYRYERIIQDIAEYCAQLLLSEEGGEDRAVSLHYLKSNFLPGSTITCADRTEIEPGLEKKYA